MDDFIIGDKYFSLTVGKCISAPEVAVFNTAKETETLHLSVDQAKSLRDAIDECIEECNQEIHEANMMQIMRERDEWLSMGWVNYHGENPPPMDSRVQYRVINSAVGKSPVDAEILNWDFGSDAGSIIAFKVMSFKPL